MRASRRPARKARDPGEFRRNSSPLPYGWNADSPAVEQKGDVRLKPEVAAGQEGDLRLLVRYQACDDARCLPPAELVRTVPLKVVSAQDADSR